MNTRCNRRQKGFSLVELMVALLILHLGMAALYLTHHIFSRAKQMSYQRDQMRMDLVSASKLLQLLPREISQGDSTWSRRYGNCAYEFTLKGIDASLYEFSDHFYTFEELQWFAKRPKEWLLISEPYEANCPRGDTLWFVPFVETLSPSLGEANE